MIVRWRRWLLLLGLGAVAGAVLPRRVEAQVPVRPDTTIGKKDTARTRVDTAGGRLPRPPAGTDTIKVKTPARADSMVKNDSIIKGIVPLPEPVKLDTMRAPLTRAEMPPILEIGMPRIYDRSALFATGALTLGDLLARVPGLSEYSTGFLGAAVVVASEGDLRRIRLFLDGLEIDPMNRRARGVAAINELPIHALEEVRIERSAEEVRVYARSWRVDRTTAYTRADIETGDQGTNLYRAYFGRRYDHGEAFQFSAEQASTQPNTRLPSSDLLHMMARVGTTKGPWSIDGFVERSHVNRAEWVGTGNQIDTRDTVPSIQTERQTAYARFGNGDPDTGRWFQLLASANSYTVSARSSTALSGFGSTDTTTSLDTVSFASQYLITGGVTRGRFALSGAQRIRVGDHRISHVASGRGSAALGKMDVSLFGEGRSYLNPSRLEGSVKLAPLDRIALVASVSQTGSGIFDRLFVEPRTGRVLDENATVSPPSESALGLRDTAEVTQYALGARSNQRLEAGVKVRDLWITAGLLKRGPTTLLSPGEFGAEYQRAGAVRAEPEATARTLAVRGRLYRAINADAWAVAWNDSLGAYRPKYQTRTELYLQTNLLNKFPKGNFGLLGSLAHEYRSSSRFPVAGDTARIASGYRSVTFKLELRIATAVVTYQFRNLIQENYAQVPGFNLPRQTQFYGVRWDFWN